MRNDSEEACQRVRRFVGQEYGEGKQRDPESENEPNGGVEENHQELMVKDGFKARKVEVHSGSGSLSSQRNREDAEIIH